jgi:hypothetical protein
VVGLMTGIFRVLPEITRVYYPFLRNGQGF